MYLVNNFFIVQSEGREQFLNPNLRIIISLLITVVIIYLIFFGNLFLKSTYLIKSFGKLSVEPEVAFKNDKPTFLEFYAEWCEVCKEMAPEVSALREKYDGDINFVFLNVDNQKWGNYIRKFDVNGIPQVNLFDRESNLKSTFIGKQNESTIRDALANLEKEMGSNEEIYNPEFSEIKDYKNNLINPRSHG